MTDLRTAAGTKTFTTLRQLAASKGKDERTFLQRYALERLLQRIFTSRHADRFVLKGGLTLCFAEGIAPEDARATADADITLPPFDGTMDEFREIMVEILSAVPEEDDGSRFDVANLKIDRQRDGDIAGGAISVMFHLGGLMLKLKTDVTFDDRVSSYADAPEVDFPCVMGEPIRLHMTTYAHCVADKVHAFVRHGPKNHRLKDYYDVWLLLSRGKADPDDTVRMLKKTFDLFEYELSGSVDEIPALTDENAVAQRDTWEVERTARQYGVRAPEFLEMVSAIRELVEPLLQAARPAPSPAL